MPLPTRDVKRVEILKAGGPYHGVRGGEQTITVDDLDAAVESFHVLRGRLDAPLKLGHNLEQDALRDEGFLSSNGAPAAGWLDDLYREGDSLFSDWRQVPGKVADLWEAGSYAKRSAEFARGIVDQASGATHRFVVTGMALLGARLPAIQGLDDFVAMFEDEVPAYLGSLEDRTHTVLFASPESDEDDSPTDAEPTPGSGADNTHEEARMPLSDDLAEALGVDTDADESAVIAHARGLRDRADGTDTVTKERDEALAKVAALEEEADKATASEGDDEKDDGEKAELAAQVAELGNKVAMLEDRVSAGDEAARKLHAQEREQVIGGAIKDRKLTPAQRDSWLSFYDDNPEQVVAMLADMTPHAALEGEIGDEDKPEPAEGELRLDDEQVENWVGGLTRG